MPRTIWKGAVSFGMVAIPIKLYPATQSKDIAFVTLHKTCDTRLRQRRYCETDEEYVDYAEVVRGYEYTKDQYVRMEPNDFESLPLPSTRNIEITRFVNLTDIDPVFFDKSYVLEPEMVGQKPFALLKEALEKTNRIAIAKVSLRQKEHLCSLRPFDGGIIMVTMYYPDEIRGYQELDMAEEKDAVSEQELTMATMLIDQLTGDFEPELYQDEYRGALEKVIEAKLGAPDAVVAAPAPMQQKVGDLMEALRASIESAKSATNGDTSVTQDAAEAEKETTATTPG